RPPLSCPTRRSSDLGRDRRIEPLITKDEIIALGKSVLEDEAKAVREAAQSLNGDFAGGARLIAESHGRLVVAGMGKAGFVAEILDRKSTRLNSSHT